MKIRFILAVASLALTLAAQAQEEWASSVVSYTPGYTNGNSFTEIKVNGVLETYSAGIKANYQNSGAALGPINTAATVDVPDASAGDIVGIGEGGELTLKFSSPIINSTLNPSVNHPYSLDFTIFGNEFFVWSAGSGSALCGLYDHTNTTVWVSEDGVNFYQIVSPYGAPSGTGMIPTTTIGADDAFPTNGAGNPFLPLDPTLKPNDFVGLTTEQAVNLYNGSAGGESYSISWAVDANGNPVNLPEISYVRIVGGPTSDGDYSGYAYVDTVAGVESLAEPSSIALLFAGGTDSNTSATFESFGSPAINSAGNCAFQAIITGTWKGAKNAEGIWLSGTNGLELIARTGTGAVPFTALGDPVLNNSGQVAFLGTLKGEGKGIWTTANASGTLQEVAQVNGPVPDATGTATIPKARFASFTQIVLPDEGGVVFLATLKGVAAAANEGIWAVDSTGLLKRIAGKGNTVTSGGMIYTVTALDLFNSTEGTTAQTRNFNGQGMINSPWSLIYRATLKNNQTKKTEQAIESLEIQPAD